MRRSMLCRWRRILLLAAAPMVGRAPHYGRGRSSQFCSICFCTGYSCHTSGSPEHNSQVCHRGFGGVEKLGLPTGWPAPDLKGASLPQPAQVLQSPQCVIQ